MHIFFHIIMYEMLLFNIMFFYVLLIIFVVAYKCFIHLFENYCYKLLLKYVVLFHCTKNQLCWCVDVLPLHYATRPYQENGPRPANHGAVLHAPCRHALQASQCLKMMKGRPPLHWRVTLGRMQQPQHPGNSVLSKSKVFYYHPWRS